MKVLLSLVALLGLSSCSTPLCEYYKLNEIPGHVEPGKIKDTNKKDGYCVAPADEITIEENRVIYDGQCGDDNQSTQDQALDVIIGMSVLIQTYKEEYASGQELSFTMELDNVDCLKSFLIKVLKEQNIKISFTIDKVKDSQYLITFKKSN